MDRHPPPAVSQTLRSEVNFGCPVQDCGSPFLTWHHFDPPWCELNHHDPKGMIALCPRHAGFADNNLYSKLQLNQFKKQPFVKDLIGSAWAWESECLLAFLGPVAVFGTGPVLAIGGRDVLSVSKKPFGGGGPNSVHIDVDLRDGLDAQILTMRQNWLELKLGSVLDFRVPTRGRELELLHRDGTRLSLHFKRYTMSELEWLLNKLFKKQPSLQAPCAKLASELTIDSDGLVPALRIEGRFHNRDLDLRASKNDLVLHYRAGRAMPERASIGPRVFGLGSSLTHMQHERGFDSPAREVLRFGGVGQDDQRLNTSSRG